MSYDELIKQVLAKPMRVVPRKDAPEWYLKINDMVANSPLMKELKKSVSKVEGRE